MHGTTTPNTEPGDGQGPGPIQLLLAGQLFVFILFWFLLQAKQGYRTRVGTQNTWG